MINFWKWILSQSQIFNFILLGSGIIMILSLKTKIKVIIIISYQKLPTQHSVEPNRTKPLYFEDCRDRCSSEYHGFPYPFHNYKEIMSSLDGKAERENQAARYDIDSRKPILYVDAVYDFERSAWFTGNGLIENSVFQIIESVKLT